MDQWTRASREIVTPRETGERGISCDGYFQVSGLGGREPGTGYQVRVQVQDLNFPAPAPVPDYLHLRPDGRDLGPGSSSLLVNVSTGQRVN